MTINLMVALVSPFVTFLKVVNFLKCAKHGCTGFASCILFEEGIAHNTTHSMVSFDGCPGFVSCIIF